MKQLNWLLLGMLWLTACVQTEQQSNQTVEKELDPSAGYEGNRLISNECVGHTCLGEPYQTTLNFYAVMGIRRAEEGQGHEILLNDSLFLRVEPDAEGMQLHTIFVHSKEFSTLTREELGTPIKDCLMLQPQEPVYFDALQGLSYIAPKHLSRFDKQTGEKLHECRLYFAPTSAPADYPRPINERDQSQMISLIVLTVVR